MTAVLAFVRMTTGRPLLQCTATVRLDTVMGWEAEFVVVQLRQSGVISALNAAGFKYTVGSDSATGVPRLTAGLGNLSLGDLLKRLRPMMPTVDRNLPEVFYWLNGLPEDEHTEPHLVLVVDTTHNTIAVKQHVIGVEAWPADVWTKFGETVASLNQFGTDILQVHPNRSGAILELSTHGIVNIDETAQLIAACFAEA